MDCPDCDAELVQAVDHEDHGSPAGDRYKCFDCGSRWERDASGLLVEIDDERFGPDAIYDDVPDENGNHMTGGGC